MSRWLLIMTVVLGTSTAYAQTDAVTFAADAGIFVGAASACGAADLVEMYTHRVHLALTELAQNASEAMHAAVAFLQTQTEARNWHVQHPDVTPCPSVLHMVRQQPLIQDVNRAVQQRLQDLGFDPGTPDGIWGRKTTQALRRYQGTQGLPGTGMLDLATHRALGIALPGVP